MVTGGIPTICLDTSSDGECTISMGKEFDCTTTGTTGIGISTTCTRSTKQMIGNVCTSVSQAVCGITVLTTPAEGTATTIGGIRIPFTPAWALSISFR